MRGGLTEGVRYMRKKGHSWPGKNFVCTSCTTLDEDGMKPNKNLCDGVGTVNGFCYLGDKLILNGGCEAAVSARMRTG